MFTILPKGLAMTSRTLNSTDHPVTDPAIDVTSVNIWTSSFVERGKTFERLRRSRGGLRPVERSAPVSWQKPTHRAHFKPDPCEFDFWAIVRNTDIAYVSQNHVLFSSD